MENNNQQSFYQFSDQLRVHTSNLANLSLNDSIWSVNSYPSKKTENRRNFDIRVGGDIGNGSIESKFNNNPVPNSDFNNSFNDGWKVGSGFGSGINLNGGFNKGIYSKGVNQDNQFLKGFNVNNNIGLKGHKNVNLKGDDNGFGGKSGKKNKEVKKENNNNISNNNNKDNNNGDGKNGVDKRFKTLPPSEALPRNETVGGYIFVCNNDTMEENLKRQLFGMFF